MQHRAHRAPRWVQSGALSTAVAALLLEALGCGSDHTRVDRVDASAEPPLARDAGPLDAGTPAAAPCESAPACDVDAAVACRLSCTASASGCVATSEFAPFGVIPEQYGMGIAAVDPDGQYLYFRYGYLGSAVRGQSYRWSAVDGVVPLDEWLGVSAIAQKGDEAFVIVDVSPGEGSVLGLFVESDTPSAGFSWTRADGATRLDFVPSAMSADGTVVVGIRQRQAVIWNRAAGTRLLAGETLEEAGPSSFAEVSAGGDVALFDVGEGNPMLWRAGSGVVRLHELLGVVPGQPIRARLHPNGRAVFGHIGNVAFEATRAFVWSESSGVHIIDELPGQPEGAAYSLELASADGGAFVGRASTVELGSSVFRWSEEAGMQRLTAQGRSAFPLFIDATGDTIIGRYLNAGAATTFRWSAAGGTTDIDGDVGGRIALDGDLLVSPLAAGPEVSRFERALETEPLALDEALRHLAPPGWSLPPAQPARISDDARLLAGVAQDPSGHRRGWVLQVRDTCPP
jgi:hypothetical protein